MSKIKKAKDTKKCVIKRKIKFEGHKNCLQAAQIENKIDHLEKNRTDLLKEDHQKFIKNNKLILKTQQRFKSENYNVFTKETNRIALSSNDDKIIQSIDSIEIYAYEMSKDLVYKKEEVKCNNIIK